MLKQINRKENAVDDLLSAYLLSNTSCLERVSMIAFRK
jgi:hypothetical protein